MAKRITGKEAYKKNRKRLLDATREVRKAGYILELDLPTVKQIEKSGKGFAGINRKLGKIKGKKVGEIKVVDPYTGEIVKLRQARKIVREAPTVTMIDTVRNWIESLPDYRDFYHRRIASRLNFVERKNVLLQILDNCVREEGASAVERRLEQNEEKIKERIDAILYDSDSTTVETSFIALANMIKGSELSIAEATEISQMGEWYSYEET